MCGLIGLVLRFDPAARLDLAPFDRAAAALAGWTLAGAPGEDEGAAAEAAAERLRAAAEALARPSLELVGWAGFRTLHEDPAAQGRIGALTATLEAAADAIDARLAQAGAVGSAQRAEALARAASAARDVAWRLGHDALPNVAGVADLLPEAERDARPIGDPATLKGWFELWRLHLILNQLERLEVRGRDSGGLGTVVHVPGVALEQLEAALEEQGLLAELDRRRRIEALRDGGVLVAPGPAGGRVGGGGPTGGVVLAFVHKVAREIGELGDNVRALRAKLRADALWRALIARADARVQVLAHTRWASNGIINEPNCHPVGNDLEGASGAPLARVVLGALNGDVDNYPTLATRWAIPSSCTTDAKVIPLEVERLLAAGEAPAQAVRLAVNGFTGSTAIGVIASDEPEALHFALRGSGQAVYVGALPGGGYLCASELYGVVELADRYYKLDGERGEVVRLAAGEGGVTLTGVRYDGAPLELGPATFRPMPIATRDIDRGGYSHYFLKEINESPRSVERTLRGKFVVEPGGRARLLLGEEVVPPRVRAALAAGTLRRVFVVGQGTAAVAGLAAADFMGRVLRGAAIEVIGLPATDLSGFHLDRLGPDALVIAVSQSGTTTDTNRTVDLARARGAHVIGIVNRRGSDLTDKAHGVLYTSDGRDVEMSVASTKAFYCQVVAGYLLALQLGALAGQLEEPALAEHLLRLQDLPRCLRDVLESAGERIRQAAQLAIRRRHWSVVGSGPLMQAAREIRIKLSELCYKSVSVDTIEDKKHIDLSSEPMILVCAAGLSGAAAADAVKEVAIFKAHAAAPVVVCDRGETRFAEYAAATLPVPATSPELALLLNTIVGHLFSFEVARAIDACAVPLRRIRDAAEAAFEALAGAEPAAAAEAGETLARLQAALAPVERQVWAAASDGAWNAALAPEEAVRLALALRLDGADPQLRGERAPAPIAERLRRLLVEVVRAVEQLRRPIDAIKHQAKTVTVGISREAAAIRPPAGPLVQALAAVGVPAEAIADHDAAALAGVEPAIGEALGAVHYRLEGLSPLGAPTDGSVIRVTGKSGIAAELPSRADAGAPLQGTKRRVALAPQVWVGCGRGDGRSLVLCPLYEEGRVRGLGLVHVRFNRDLDRRARVRALKAVGRYEDLRCAVTEGDVPWSDALLDEVAPQALLTDSVERLAEALLAGHDSRQLSGAGEGERV